MSLIVRKNSKQFVMLIAYLISILLLSVPLFAWAEETSKVELTTEEQGWKAQSVAREEADYLFENLNDRLIFMVADLLDIYHDDFPREQDEYETKTAHLITANPICL